MEALHDVIKAGKARYIGASSMWAWQFATMQHAAQTNGWTRFVSMQDQYSLIHREEERETFGLLAYQGVGSIPWSPLSGGLVTRPGVNAPRSEQGSTGKSTRRTGRYTSTATRSSSRPCSVSPWPVASMAQVAMAWVLKNPVVSAAIVGATRPHHLADAVGALDIKLTAEEIDSLEEPYVTRQPTFC